MPGQSNSVIVVILIVLGKKLMLYVVEAEVGLLRVNQLIYPPIMPAIANVFSSFVVTLIVHF